MRELSEQEKFWQGDFGNQYVGRNVGQPLVAANLALFLSFAHFEAFVAYVPVLAGLVWLTARGGARQRLRYPG